MHTGKDEKGLSAAVFDPSHRVDGSYWQWTSGEIDSLWDAVGSQINKAWPTRIGEFNDQNVILYGVLQHGEDSVWLYRVFLAGRDNFGRPGRYFFVLFKLASPEQITDHRVAGVIDYFEGERALPLNVKPIDSGLPSKQPNAILQRMQNESMHRQRRGHWGMDGSGKVSEFAVPESIQEIAGGEPLPGSTARANEARVLRLAAGPLKSKLVKGAVALALAIAGCGMYYCYQQGLAVGLKNGLAEGKDIGLKKGTGDAHKKDQKILDQMQAKVEDLQNENVKLQQKVDKQSAESDGIGDGGAKIKANL